jgi:hypothetical protein
LNPAAYHEPMKTTTAAVVLLLGVGLLMDLWDKEVSYLCYFKCGVYETNSLIVALVGRIGAIGGFAVFFVFAAAVAAILAWGGLRLSGLVRGAAARWTCALLPIAGFDAVQTFVVVHNFQTLGVL